MTLAIRTLRDRFLARRHTALLAALVVAFVVRPLIGDAGVAPFVFSISFLILMVIALYTIQVDELVGERDLLLTQRRRRTIVVWTLAVLAIAERLGMLFAPSAQLYLVGSMSWLLFFSFVTWAELRSVLKQKRVTSETISMSISVYLLIGLSWGLLYAVIFQHQPEAFAFGASARPTFVEHNVFPTFMYFSLTTLSTIGFGDITPASLQARYAAVAEGITGQFYLAILVARLVGMQMSRSVD
jgi:hypothetical protein